MVRHGSRQASCSPVVTRGQGQRSYIAANIGQCHFPDQSDDLLHGRAGVQGEDRSLQQITRHRQRTELADLSFTMAATHPDSTSDLVGNLSLAQGSYREVVTHGAQRPAAHCQPATRACLGPGLVPVPRPGAGFAVHSRCSAPLASGMDQLSGKRRYLSKINWGDKNEVNRWARSRCSPAKQA